MKPRAATEAVKKAAKKITTAADYNRTKEAGTAYFRLNDIYKKALKSADIKTALAAQKEISKLIGLYGGVVQNMASDDGESDITDSQAELTAIGKHLLPLGLAPDDYPLKEHARIAAEKIRGMVA